MRQDSEIHEDQRWSISEKMRRVKSQDTAPELLLRHALWSTGLRYRLHLTDLPGKPDIVLPSQKIAIFVDGDYWHGNQWRLRGYRSVEEQLESKHNSDYWVHKITGNVLRDQDVVSKLTSNGWKVLRFWESDILKDVASCAEIVRIAVENKEDPSVICHLDRSVAEFFAGIGLMRMGLERAGWFARFANDFDPDKLEMYRQNFADAEAHFSLSDVHKLHADAVPTVTLATASFPCNDLSLAGAMRGLEGEQSGAFWGFHRVIHDMGHRKPAIILLENVMGFIHTKDGQDFRSVLLALNDLDYVCDTFAIDAACFVPQSRPRLFVVGMQKTLVGDRSVHPMLLSETSVRPMKLVQFIVSHPEIQWRIRELPDLPHRRLQFTDILEDLPEGAPEWWSKERVDYLRNQMSPKHGAIADRMMAGEKETYGAVFRRVRNGKSMAELRVDGLAGALRTPRGGSGRQILFAAGQGRRRARLLTPRECARLMGADSYVIDVPLNQALFGFGDAVCVPVIEWIARTYLNPLLNETLHGRLLAQPPENSARLIEYA